VCPVLVPELFLWFWNVLKSVISAYFIVFCYFYSDFLAVEKLTRFFFIVSIIRGSWILWCVGCYANFFFVAFVIFWFLSILVLEFMDVYLEVHAMT